MTQTVTRNRERTIYSPNNPPTNKNLAINRLIALNKTIANITAAIKVKDPKVFTVARDYQMWRRKAAIALEHYTLEKTYILGWMSSEKREDVGLVGMTKEFLSRTENLYIRLYDENKLPSNKTEANTQKIAISRVKRKLESFLTYLKNTALERHATQGEYDEAAALIKIKINTIEEEFACIKEYRRRSNLAVPEKIQTAVQERHLITECRNGIQHIYELLGVSSAIDVAEILYKIMGDLPTESLSPNQTEQMKLIHEYLDLHRRQRELSILLSWR